MSKMKTVVYENIVIIGEFPFNETKSWIYDEKKFKDISLINLNKIDKYKNLFDNLGWISNEKLIPPKVRKLGKNDDYFNKFFKMQENEKLKKFIMPYYQKDNVYIFNEKLLKKLSSPVTKKLNDIKGKNNLICLHHFGYYPSNHLISYNRLKNDSDFKSLPFSDFTKSKFIMFHHANSDKTYNAVKSYLENNENDLLEKLNEIILLPNKLDEIDNEYLKEKKIDDYKNTVGEALNAN